MSEPSPNSPFMCNTSGSIYTGMALRKVPTNSYHNTTTDQAQSTTFSVPPGELKGPMWGLSCYDDVQGLYTYKEIDPLNIPLPPSASVNIHHTQYSCGPYAGSCFTQGYNHDVYSEQTYSMSSDLSQGLLLSSSQESHDGTIYSYETPSRTNHAHHSHSSSFSDMGQPASYHEELHASSYDSQQSCFSDESRLSSFSETPRTPFSIQELPCAMEKFSTYFHESPKPADMDILSPEGSDSDQGSSEACGTAVQQLERVSSLLSSTPTGHFSNVDPRVRATSLFNTHVPKRVSIENCEEIKALKIKRPLKKPKVLKEFPSVADFVYDPNHEYDPFVQPTSAAMAMLMSCLKPTKKDQVMILKENKRQFWQPNSKYRCHSYVDRILASETLIAMLFKSKKGPIACNHCSLKFENYLAIAAHFDQYNVTRPGRCKYDDCLSSVLGFASPSEQSRHTKTQHGNTAYTCSAEGCAYHSPRLDCVKRHYCKNHGEEADSKVLSKGVRALKDLPNKFQDVKKSKTLTDEEVRQQVAPILAKLRELL
ncbi:hypothetical protein B0I72DRAFT_163085 [Yarrowia lipolytica]|uniref:YALI0E14971p n=2 Tax=Yarrowia lipolytica TaxID=4952 RepID=Q6C5V1_YARLI|nr:YALI0E14971p [Yarrowia lipolytica CLIB122]RDW28706.1 hypothetical protein B0I71DRAFT_112426 [Yarrowia lipolytica]RDW35834.1 hypothetical protein B0I72DRAFT_163085 [Yarrowia lipolytica]RDW41668.1 hypothetical protein B0I73DRAFT_93385 [Yarrowia lipolytica]RDW47038.1 hypothetical protein B0I74DRAFT_163055 [Yarrowia lipolytica]RDW54466.1 hypothetical protein B0I75DRAFT_167755 [Yarrowia lipolytica]|eukprot:XP_503961.1 YALI0E14971p [Yarrowia lipolytica CLIB122]